MLIFLDEEKFHEAVNAVTDDNRIESTKRGDIGAAYEDLTFSLRKSLTTRPAKLSRTRNLKNV